MILLQRAEWPCCERNPSERPWEKSSDWITGLVR